MCIQILTQSGSILASKILKESHPKPIKIDINFWIVIFPPKTDFGSQTRFKMEPQRCPWNGGTGRFGDLECQKNRFGRFSLKSKPPDINLIDFGNQNGSKNDQKIYFKTEPKAVTEEAAKKVSFWTDLGTIFKRFLIDFQDVVWSTFNTFQSTFP